MSTIRLKDGTRELLAKFANTEGPARICAAAVLDLLAIQAGEDAHITMGLRRSEFSDLLEGQNIRAQLLAMLLDVLEDIIR